MQQWVIVAAITCVPVTLAAQNISATTDRSKILIGEQVELTLKLSGINPATTAVVQWFTLNDSNGHIITVQRNPVDTVNLDGRITYIERYRLTSFDSGKWTLPPLRVLVQQSGQPAPEWITADSITIEVVPVQVSDMGNYHPVKEIEEVEVQPNYLLYGAIAISVLLVLVLGWKLLRNKKPTLQEQAVYKPDALSMAVAQVEALRKQYQSGGLPVKAYYTGLTDICREYVAAQLNIRSGQSTSDELMILLGVYLQQESIRTELYQMLRLADVVKFARYTPSEAQDTAAAESMVNCLRHIDNMLRTIQNNTISFSPSKPAANG